MTIRISIKTGNLTPSLIKYKLTQMSRRTILSYHFGADEIKLDEYLIKKYKLGLRLTCLELIYAMKIYTSNDGIVIKFLDPKMDKLARIITYGTGKSPKSSILCDAFRRY